MPISGKLLLYLLFLATFSIYTFFVFTSGISSNQKKLEFSEEAKKGKLIFQKYNCISCHQIYGLGGYMGPDLTNSYSSEGGKEAMIRAYLMSGTDKMPNFQLSSEEIDALVEFLKYLEKTGTYPVTNFEVSPWGIIDVNGK